MNPPGLPPLDERGSPSTEFRSRRPRRAVALGVGLFSFPLGLFGSALTGRLDLALFPGLPGVVLMLYGIRGLIRKVIVDEAGVRIVPSWVEQLDFAWSEIKRVEVVERAVFRVIRLEVTRSEEFVEIPPRYVSVPGVADFLTCLNAGLQSAARSR